MPKKQRFLSSKSPAQAMLEFALVVPILLLLIYGLIEVGRLLFIYNSVVSAARQAARYGAAIGLNEDESVPRYRDCAGMRAAAQRLGFLDTFDEEDILIWHDEGEDKNQTAYCTPGMDSDPSFHPSSGNTSRVRVQVSTEYSPILHLTSFQPFTISSVSARTILVSVQLAVTGSAHTYQYMTVTPALTGTVTTVPRNPRSAATAAACDVRHSPLKTSPFGMTIFNYSTNITVHIKKISIWEPRSPAGQATNRIALGGSAIWSGMMPGEMPTVFDAFSGDTSIQPRSSKFLRIGFIKNYDIDGAEKILVAFIENECPLLDSSDLSQLP